jgi:multiple sugar transport system permease protein
LGDRRAAIVVWRPADPVFQGEARMAVLRRKAFLKSPGWFLAPVLIYYVAFWIRPTISIIVESFTDKAATFGFDNYARLFAQEQIRTAFINTVLFTIGSALIQFALAFALALWLNKKFKFSNLVLFITLIPMAFPPAAVGILWKTGLYRFGWLNSLLCSLGLMNPANPFDWMSLRNLNAVMLLIIVDTWTVLPSVMIILLAGLQNLNREFEEAGWVFGANKFRTLKDIVVPIMKPTIITAMLLRMIAAIQVWLIAVMIFGYNVTPFLVERIAYNVDVITFAKYARKDAYTISVIVTAIVLISVTLYLRVSKDRRSEGGAA